MASTATFGANREYIELHRTFQELPKDIGDHENVRAFLGGERLRWPNLIEEYRLIVLSEAGSGKSTEILNVARTLRKQGKPAFFLRLEHIPHDFEVSFEVGTCEQFQEWLASGEEGWLLLDSVDEARLRNPGDFHLAILKLSRRISTSMDRTHIIITGRTTAWRPKTDLAFCMAQLPHSAAVRREPDTDVENDGPDGSLQIETNAQDRAQSGFKVVALDDLTSDQIAVFVNARGIEDGKAFLDAVERADAWSFTSRPQDLQEITEFWIDKGRIGSRLEIMRNSIDRRLAERHQGRADNRPLSVTRARQGARLLAAATTLIQDPTIKVPDGAENHKGIAVQSVLSDWDDKDQLTLLSRPIFDEAIYGSVRFHHRSVREYLAAEWFAELLKCETSRRTIEELFFRHQYGLDIVVPTLRPILPWLAILDEKIRERVRKVAPEVILEGGDPSQLPLEVRRHILHEVCEKMADATGPIQDYAAVQRFANPDLTDEVRTLIRRYSDNDDVTFFLLRIVWLGQLVGVLPEALSVALMPTPELYTRMAAFRAIMAIGSNEDHERVRQSSLAEAPNLRREWLAELLIGLPPTEKSVAWLLSGLEKSESKEHFTVDRLGGAVSKFVATADIELLPQFVSGSNTLLSRPPVIERRHCRVSKKFQWLLLPTCKAIGRLISARHLASLDPHALDILHKVSAVHDYGSDDLTQIYEEFSRLVPAWKELNRKLFWHEVNRSRKLLDKKSGERLTEFWKITPFQSLWQFDEADFEYVVGEISRQATLDNRLVALSLAFHLYQTANRRRSWREQLRRSTRDDNQLLQRLSIYLRPPAQEQKRRLKQQEAKWKKRHEAHQKKTEDYQTKWKEYLDNNLEEVRTSLRAKPGVVTNALNYLYEQTRNRKANSTRWTEYSWETLIPEYGEEVARLYRDGAVSFWRHHEPQLRSEGAPLDKTTLAVIIGLVGLEIEAHETKDWAKNLSVSDVVRACKYASFELNGFPTWFPKLFETHPKAVGDFLMGEVRFELSIEQPGIDTHYVISDLSWSGRWAWNQFAPSIYEILKTTEPKNLSNLNHLLKILQGSDLADDLIEKLASEKCRMQQNLSHVACWFAVWTGVAPESAIAFLKNQFQLLAEPQERTLFAMTFVTQLWGDHRGDGTTVRQAFKTPEFLKSLYMLVRKYVRHDEDTHRTGTSVYSPGLRDDAQSARDGLLRFLGRIPGKESYLALMDIAKSHSEEPFRSWAVLQAKNRAEQDGDIEPWLPSQVREFHDRLERTPRSHRELAELAVLRFLDLKDDLEQGDGSIAVILRGVTQETDVRKYIGRELREKAFGRYSIPQEEELADAKRPDLRFHGADFDGPVPVELKLADKWTGPKLFERLENQLCADYLRDNRSNRGIFLLVYRGEKTGWGVPGSENRVDFAGLIDALQDHWWRISPRFSHIDDIRVIGIDLTRRSS